MNAIKLTKEVKPLMTKHDLTKDTFRYVESLWFRHHTMVKKLRELELITSAISRTSVDENAGIRAVGRISKPVEQEVVWENITIC